MEIELKKWGNSIGLRIPFQVAQNMGLEESSTIELIQSGDRLILKKKQAINLDELIASIPDDFKYPDDVQNFAESESQGREII